jgi:uncharacterized protein YggU (UPF0235/DUF167 family)
MKGITVELRVHPRARRTALAMVAGVLKASVTAPPEDGKANDAVIALLSREWRLPKSAFAVIKGATTRDKTIGVSGEPAALANSIDTWMQAHG